MYEVRSESKEHFAIERYLFIIKKEKEYADLMFPGPCIFTQKLEAVCTVRDS
jgi:hypothetical protein